jgi:probable HAF family extracellular repeat protein
VASGINDIGEVVGYFQDANRVFHGFVLVDGSYYPTDVPGATSTAVLGIDNAGDIVGQYYDSNGDAYAFLASGSPAPAPPSLVLLG